jgi:hypothetical protein
MRNRGEMVARHEACAFLSRLTGGGFLHAGADCRAILAASEAKGMAMPDDKAETGSDRRFISLEQTDEVHDWMTSLGCSEEQLREAVNAVGNSADAVSQYFAAKRAGHP